MSHAPVPIDRQTRVAALKSQFPKTLIGLPDVEIALSWAISSDRIDAAQLSYEIEASADSNFTSVLAATGVVDSPKQVSVRTPKLVAYSREIRYYRVKIQTEYGWTDWSESLTVEFGLLDASDYLAVFIGDSSPKFSPSPILRKEVILSNAPTKARLYVTSLGLNHFYINGIDTSNTFLNPGWTAYRHRLLVETHDVTHLLHEGVNALGAEISDGWWRGKLGFMNESALYGNEIGLFAQLEVAYSDGSSETFSTDTDWVSSNAEIVFSSIYDGSTIDFRNAKPGWKQPGFDASDWQNTSIVACNKHILAPRSTNPVRKVGEFALKVEPQADRSLLRGTQNISGWVRLVVDGKAGQTVVVRHAEVLEPGDKLHTKALRSAKATDTYILQTDGRHVLEPRFTFHGFQHADVVTEAEIVSAVAVAISSDNDRRSWFESSDYHLNRLHENVVWSQLDNFVSVPTDCPQRDERLGWTGDAQAFASTSNTLFNTNAFWNSWLQDLALEQFENGDVTAIVPDIFKTGEGQAIDGWIMEGRAGWADAATIIPLSLYEYFADEQVLSAQLESMRKWVGALLTRRGNEKFLPTQFQFGDWCDPDAPGDRPWEAKVSADYVANSFFAHSLDLLARAERLVGEKTAAESFESLSRALKADIWHQMGEAARLTTAGCSIALEFDIAPAEQRTALAQHLADMVKNDEGMITTGFLATPLVLHALSKNGHADAAYAMLMRRDFRSWLYAIDKGATSIWERWDAIREDGSIHTGAMDTEPDGQDDSSMISFNHYAYGAVVDWIYRNVAGIAPSLDGPGYQTAVIEPKPANGLTFAKAEIKSALGKWAIDWKLDPDQKLIVNLDVPFGAKAEVQLPAQGHSVVRCNGVEIGSSLTLTYGKYLLTVTDAAVITY